MNSTSVYSYLMSGIKSRLVRTKTPSNQNAAPLPGPASSSVSTMREGSPVAQGTHATPLPVSGTQELCCAARGLIPLTEQLPIALPVRGNAHVVAVGRRVRVLDRWALYL